MTGGVRGSLSVSTACGKVDLLSESLVPYCPFDVDLGQQQATCLGLDLERGHRVRASASRITGSLLTASW